MSAVLAPVLSLVQDFVNAGERSWSCWLVGCIVGLACLRVHQTVEAGLQCSILFRVIGKVDGAQTAVRSSDFVRGGLGCEFEDGVVIRDFSRLAGWRGHARVCW